MLIRSIRQLIAVLGTLCFITLSIVVLRLYDASSVAPYIVERWGDQDLLGGRTGTPDFESAQSLQSDGLPNKSHDDDEFDLNVYGRPVHEVFSVSTKKGKYFRIDFGDHAALNPNILPHPTKPDTWILVAQQKSTDTPNSVWFAELVCEAQFKKGKLACIKSPLLLPIAATLPKQGGCTGNANFLAFNIGPHDARAFYGPSNPYVMYGSQASYNCFGLWTQDLRYVTDWGVVIALPNDPANPFRFATELQRPPPIGMLEKNWFLFWDKNNEMYVHFDIYPKRGFARLSGDGSAGPDLSIGAAKQDEKCMARYMPKLAPAQESIHQATNSLSITLCKRDDPTCKPTDANTYIMTIFQHKTYYSWHGVYEPYVMLFQQTAPFAVHGISQKPIWIHGRGKAQRPDYLTKDAEWDQTEMFYVTSISWKSSTQKYHGYIDDVLFIGFGIEDSAAAAIDVTAGDILDHLGLCSDAENIVNPGIPDLSLTGSGLPDASALDPTVAAGLGGGLPGLDASDSIAASANGIL